MNDKGDFTLVGASQNILFQDHVAKPHKTVFHLHWLSFILFGIIALCCLCAPLLANHDPTHFYLQNLNEPPNTEFYFGTDSMGRDLYSILWYGGRVSLSIGFLSMGISSFLGIAYGCLSGTASAWLDNIMMRAAELVSSIPSILLMLLFLAFIPDPGILSISCVIGLTTWMNLARIVRSEVRQIRSSDYVWAAKMMGGGFWHVLYHHLLPNFLSSILFMMIASIGTAMLTESTLSFLGIGLPVEIVSWGSMLSLANRALLTNAWWVVVIPGLFLVVTLVCITNIGHAFRHHVIRNSSNL